MSQSEMEASDEAQGLDAALKAADHTTHFDDCGCKSKALEAERDALRLRVAAMTAAGDALLDLDTEDTQMANRLAAEWNAAKRGDTTALRAMLVEACQEMRFSAIIDGDAYLKWDETGESIADRILGASKEGGE